MNSACTSTATSRDQSPWRVFKGRRPWAQAAQAAGFGARPRVSRVAATLPFRDGLPFPAAVHAVHAHVAQHRIEMARLCANPGGSALPRPRCAQNLATPKKRRVEPHRSNALLAFRFGLAQKYWRLTVGIG